MNKDEKLRQCEARFAQAWVEILSMIRTVRSCQANVVKPDKTLMRRVEDTMHNVVLKGIADEYERLGGVVYRYSIKVVAYTDVPPGHSRIADAIRETANGSSVVLNQEYSRVVDHIVAFATTEKEAANFVSAVSFVISVEMHIPPKRAFNWFTVAELTPVRLSTMLYGDDIRNKLHCGKLPPIDIPLRSILDGSYTDFFL